MADPLVVAPPSGLKTTEMWLAMLLLGALAWLGHQLVMLLPTILATPGIPAWVAPIGSVAVVGLGWVMRLVVAEYTKARVALKLDANSDPAVAAALAEAAKISPADALAAPPK